MFTFWYRIDHSISGNPVVCDLMIRRQFICLSACISEDITFNKGRSDNILISIGLDIELRTRNLDRKSLRMYHERNSLIAGNIEISLTLKVDISVCDIII